MEPIINSPHRWYVNNFEVRLLQDQNSLAYETIDTLNGNVIHSESFEEELKTTPIDQLISSLKNLRIMIKDKGDVIFSYHYHNLNLGDKELNLIRGTDDLMWDIFCHSTKESSFLSFKESTIPSLRCHDETFALIERLKNDSFKNPESIRTLIEDFKIVKITDKEFIKNEHLKINHDFNKKAHDHNFKTLGYSALFAFASLAIGYSPIGKKTYFAVPALMALYHAIAKQDLQEIITCDCLKEHVKDRLGSILFQKQTLIEIEPKITASSILDLRVIVSKFTWAVTLITHKGSFGNHAEIVIEGINDGSYDSQSPLIGNASHVKKGEKFIHLAHFMPRIESGLISSDELLYETRTEIWMVTCEKVKQMILNIEREKTLPKGQRYEYLETGEGYVKGFKAHNCFTWSQLHLKPLGIEFKDKNQLSVSGFFAACATDYTEKPEYYKEKYTIQRI